MDSIADIPPATPAPLLGEAGGAMRDRAIEALRSRYATLDTRARRRQLTDVERRELVTLAAAIEALWEMGAPPTE